MSDKEFVILECDHRVSYAEYQEVRRLVEAGNIDDARRFLRSTHRPSRWERFKVWWENIWRV